MKKDRNYIEWLLSLQSLLTSSSIEYSDYDEFYIREAIITTEQLLKKHNIKKTSNITEKMIDEYVSHAISNNPARKQYFETVSFYVKKRLIYDNKG